MTTAVVDSITDRWVRRELTPWQAQRRRWQLLQWRASRPIQLGSNAAKYCGAALGDHVGVHVSSSGQAHVAGIQRCGSVWSCPVCAPKVRTERARDIAAAVEAWDALGGDVWFITATLPHHRSDQLSDTAGAIQKMWSDCWGGRAGKTLRENNGIVGTIRVLEITYGSNGWHPHIHALVFAKAGEFDPTRIAQRWRGRFESHGFEYVPHVSIDIRRIEQRGGIGSYLGKVEQSWGAGLELARADLKGRGGLTQAQVLEMATTGETKWVARWIEFEKATKGRLCIVWTRKTKNAPSLREQAGQWQLMATANGAVLKERMLTEEESTDEEAAAAEDADEVVAMWSVPRSVWMEWRRQGRTGELLQALIRCDGERHGCWLIRPWIDPGWSPPTASSSPDLSVSVASPAMPALALV